mgnify:CR=1 FL=1
MFLLLRRVQEGWLEIIEFFEKELGKCRDELQTGQAISYSALTNLLPLIVPLVLKLLRAVHALWISYADDAMANLPEELVKAARIMQNPAQISRLLVEIGELHLFFLKYPALAGFH